MAKSLFEELGGRYERQGDYLIPCLTVFTEEEQPTERNLCCFFRASYSYFLEKRERILTCKCCMYIMCMY